MVLQINIYGTHNVKKYYINLTILNMEIVLLSALTKWIKANGRLEQTNSSEAKYHQLNAMKIDYDL